MRRIHHPRAHIIINIRSRHHAVTEVIPEEINWRWKAGISRRCYAGHRRAGITTAILLLTSRRTGRGSLPTAALIIVFCHGDDTHAVKANTQTRRIVGIRNLHNGEENL